MDDWKFFILGCSNLKDINHISYHKTTGYNLYEPGSGQVSISRDVICNENGSWN